MGTQSKANATKIIAVSIHSTLFIALHLPCAQAERCCDCSTKVTKTTQVQPEVSNFRLQIAAKAEIVGRFLNSQRLPCPEAMSAEG